MTSAGPIARGARWHPAGAARVSAGLGGDADAERPGWFSAGVQQALARGEVAVGDAALAWELARLAVGATGAEREAVALLTLLLRDALAHGSTRLSLDPAVVRGRAGALGLIGAPMDGVLRLVERAAVDAAAGRPTLGLIGPADSGRPIVVDRGCLYLGRLRTLEVQLTAAVADLVARGRAAEALPPPGARPAVDDVVERARASQDGIALTDEQLAALRVALTSPLALVEGGPGTGKTSIVLAMLRGAVGLGVAPEEIALAAPTGKAADRMRRAVERGLGAVREPSRVERELVERLDAPRTMHRLLGFSPSSGRFRRGPGDPLHARLVVVDEASMVDVYVMTRLLAALRPGARLVLVGDAEQLPSVAAGAVFRELLESGRVPTARLRQSHRMDPADPSGSHVLSVARAVNRGALPPLAAPLEPAARGPAPGDPGRGAERALPPEGGLFEGGSFEGGSSQPDVPPRAPAARPLDAVEGARPARLALRRLDALPESLGELGGVWLHSPADARGRGRFLDAWFSQRVRPPDVRAATASTWPLLRGRVVDAAAPDLAELFARIEAARLLCVTRSRARPSGVEAVNAALHRRLAEEAGQDERGDRLLVGEPVLVNRNDYARGLFNGDQGLLLWARSESDEVPRPSAVFRDGEGFAAFGVEEVRASLELGYATTVHKAQGSEHEQVALMLPDVDSPRLWTREILYTAITRARRSVLLVGDGRLLGRAASRTVERSTGIAERLSGEPGPEAAPPGAPGA